MSNYCLKKPVAIVGIMGAGKSFFGKKLAKSLDLKFFDLDHEIKRCTEFSTKEVYNFFGEDILYQIEHAILLDVLKHDKCILAAGDITIENDLSWNLLKDNFTIIWMNIEVGLLAHRLKVNNNRPFLNQNTTDNGLIKFLKKIGLRRESRYRESNIIINKKDIAASGFMNDLLSKICINLEKQQIG